MNKFSIIIPVYNEQENVQILFEEIYLFLKKISDFEVVFVNDASTDNTLQNLKEIKSKNKNVIIINNEKNFNSRW